MVLHGPYAEPRKIDLKLEVPSRPVYATIDPDRMVQVLGNLISNAVKFSPEGSMVRTTLTLHKEYFQIRVSDQGHGVSPEFQEELFTRFAQEHRPNATQPGTGLGLAICKSIVEAHGGEIYLDTTVPTGASFLVQIPWERTGTEA